MKPRRGLGETQKGFGKTQRRNPEGDGKTQSGLDKTQRRDLVKPRRGVGKTQRVFGKTQRGRWGNKHKGGLVKPRGCA